MKFSIEVTDFITFTSTKPGEIWSLRHLWSTESGWQVEWRCCEHSLVLEAAVARKLSRYLHAQFTQRFRDTPFEDRHLPKEFEILKWVDTMDERGKEALHNNRNRIVPPESEQVPA